MSPTTTDDTTMPAEPVRSDLAIRLEEMELERAQGTTAEKPTALPLDRITMEPAVFKLRTGDLNEWLLSELGAVLKGGGELDAVTVLPCGAVFYLVDGHHRLEAYRRAKRTTIPVRCFDGEPKEARARAIRAGAKVALPLTKQELGTLAWQNLLSGAYSLVAIAKMTGVSRQNLDIMSKIRKALGDTAPDCSEWWMARRAYKRLVAGEDPTVPRDDDEWAELEQQRGREIAEKMHRAFGDRIGRNPNIAAHALWFHFGHRLGPIVEQVKALGYLGEEAEEDGDEMF